MKAAVRLSIVVALTVLLVIAVLPVSAAGPVNPPIRTIPVTGNNLVGVATGVVNNFTMQDGDAVLFPNLSQTGLKTSFSVETEKTLPDVIPDEFTLLDAISIAVVKNGKALDAVPDNAKLTISFAHDAEFAMCDGDGALAILRWDAGKGWQEISANTLEAVSNETGVFALVRR